MFLGCAAFLLSATGRVVQGAGMQKVLGGGGGARGWQQSEKLDAGTAGA